MISLPLALESLTTTQDLSGGNVTYILNGHVLDTPIRIPVSAQFIAKLDDVLARHASTMSTPPRSIPEEDELNYDIGSMEFGLGVEDDV